MLHASEPATAAAFAEGDHGIANWSSILIAVEQAMVDDQHAAFFNPLAQPRVGFRIDIVDSRCQNHLVAILASLRKLLFQNRIDGDLDLHRRG